MVKDSDLKKWNYAEHTKVKHELLEKYLGGWLPILGRWHEKLLIFDGFAGRGEYVDGSDGSPVILLRKADELISAGRVKEVVCAFVEIDPDNFAYLKAVLNRTKSQFPRVKVLGPSKDKFEKVVSEVIEATEGRIIPSFWFIDPFGFTGMSFDSVKQIMSLKRSEVFITLMLRDIGRFLTHPNLDSTFDRLFGTDEWRKIVYANKTGEEKERELLELYIAQLRMIGCKVTFFRVCMDEKLQTLYYMVHATNHCSGRWLMKNVMYQQGTNGVFAYLGPKDKVMRMQATLFPADDIPALKTQLLTKFPRRTRSYDAVLLECCDDNELREPDYRTALKELRDEETIRVKPITSKTESGLRGKDSITFPPI